MYQTVWSAAGDYSESQNKTFPFSMQEINEEMKDYVATRNQGKNTYYFNLETIFATKILDKWHKKKCKDYC